MSLMSRVFIAFGVDLPRSARCEFCGCVGIESGQTDQIEDVDQVRRELQTKAALGAYHISKIISIARKGSTFTL